MTTLSKDSGSRLEDWANTPQRRRAYAQEGLIVDVAETIYEAMDKRRVLRVDLAKQLGCSKALVSQMLNGKRNMSLRTLADIAHALGYSVQIRFREAGKEGMSESSTDVCPYCHQARCGCDDPASFAGTAPLVQPPSPVTHFANTERAMRLKSVMCGYVAPEDKITTDPTACTCADCRDWITPP